jgi:putative ABC transport system permease protein
MFNFLIENFLLGLKNLHLHKLRSLLTALGIILGVAAVIIMVAIGEGSRRVALEDLQQLGPRNIVVQSKLPPESAQASQRTSRVLDYGTRRLDLERLKTLDHVDEVIPIRNTEQKIIRGDVQAGRQAIATVPEAADVIRLPLARGRFFNHIDYDSHVPVCVLGTLVAKQLFPYQDPIGEQVLVGTAGRSAVLLTVVGVLEPTGLRPGSEAASMRQLDPDQSLYFPMSISDEAFGDTIIDIQAGSRTIKTIQLSEIWLQAREISDVERVAAEADNVMKTGHGEKDDYEVKAPLSLVRTAEKQQRMFNFIMVGIASFALIVGGIGIMNIMLATVTERTREIGIRRALGAKRRHITLQFLIETTVISLTGGLIGISIGTGFATLLPILVQKLGSGGNYPTAITSWSVIGSFVVSGAIGIGFGLYPAVIAARMNPIEALRHE